LRPDGGFTADQTKIIDDLINKTAEQIADKVIGAKSTRPLDISNSVTLLESLSERTWHRLKASQEANVSQGEETITDVILLEIKMSGMDKIRVWKCPKDLERKTGIDWEWFIGSDTQGWLRYAVQAKKLNLKTRRYDNLNHKVNDKPQIEILESYANRQEAIPLYCFYNYAEGGNFSPYWQCDLTCNKTQLGCTITPLKQIKEALARRGGRTFYSIHQNKCTLPWRCLVKCQHITRLYKERGAYNDECFDNVRIYERIPFEVMKLFGSIDKREPEATDNRISPPNNDVIPRRVMVVDLG